MRPAPPSSKPWTLWKKSADPSTPRLKHLETCMTNKAVQACPHCSTPLEFRQWSERYPKGLRWREALAKCPNGCGKFGVRYFDGRPTCKPYQVKKPARKTSRGSWRLQPDRAAAITALYGSVQEFLDNSPLVCMSLQYKT